MKRTFGAGLLLVAMALALGAAPAQDGPPPGGVPGGILFSRARQFRVPFLLDKATQQTLSQVQLYVSTDLGRSWLSVSSAPPDQGFFRFSTERDGAFWFAVQCFDKTNRAFPATMDNATPNLKVVVDTMSPQVSLQPLTPRAHEVGVGWTVRDDNFNANQPNSVRLDYRLLNSSPTWVPLLAPPGSTQYYWNPNANGPVEVRIQVRDQADNVAEAFTRVSLDGAQGGFTPPAGSPAGSPLRSANQNYQDPAAGIVMNPPSPSELKLVNSKRISLAYDLKDVGPSRVSAIDLWYTHDGRNWNKYGQPFADEANKAIVFEADREGLCGITLVAKSGVGLGERPPQTGDRPQAWIEVDLTKPAVSLRNVLVGQAIDKGKLKISWTASDKNLSPNCINLRYAESKEGPWVPIVEKLANSGEYTWIMPNPTPFQFYVKVEAFDRAGNVGDDVSTQVKVDLSIPRTILRDVTPAN